MRKILTATLTMLVLAMAAHVAAQEGVKPGPEHAVLKDWVGSWDATIRVAGGDPSKGSATYTIGLNGLWLLDHFKGEVAGMPFEGRGATSYDPAKKKYVSVWIDSMSARPMVSEGAYDKATKTLTMHGNMPTPDGKTVKTTQTIVTKDANTMVFTLKANMDGKESEMIQVTYKRRAK